MVRAGRYLPPPDNLRDQVFDVFDWDQTAEPAPAPAPRQRTIEPTFAPV